MTRFVLASGLLVLLAVAVAGGVSAQVPSWAKPIDQAEPASAPAPTNDLGPGFPNDPVLEDVPIDGGLGLLALLGAGYGAMRLRGREEG